MRSGYYSGRKPSEGDLGSKHLEMLYRGIARDVGQPEATNFVRFVNTLSDMSASAFIVAFEKFWANDCKLIAVEQEKGDRTRLDAHGVGLEVQAFGAIMGSLFGGVSDEEHARLSMSVKAQFIWKHIDEIPKEEQQKVPSGSYHF